MAVLIEELLQLWVGRAPAVSWAPEWMPFEILVWADNIFLVSSSTTDILKRTKKLRTSLGKEVCVSTKAAWKSCRVKRLKERPPVFP